MEAERSFPNSLLGADHGRTGSYSGQKSALRRSPPSPFLDRSRVVCNSPRSMSVTRMLCQQTSRLEKRSSTHKSLNTAGEPPHSRSGGCLRPFRLIPFFFVLGILSGIGYGFDSLGDRIHSLFPPALAVKQSGSRRYIRVTHFVPHNLRLECMVRKLRKYPLSAELAESESLQKLFADLPG